MNTKRMVAIAAEQTNKAACEVSWAGFFAAISELFGGRGAKGSCSSFRNTTIQTATSNSYFAGSAVTEVVSNSITGLQLTYTI